ncbi:MFS transporter [Nocardia abscessus]|uniref:MFS transporter n=1 Tax=Nocardia abscessus TaxID=120957 RepID=UPI0003199DB5|nr:MFS transporter [Nocardia abscessus]MCC3329194.1 MFS transporter [Nocardia abscessus]
MKALLALNGSARLLVLAALVNSTGTGLFLAGAVLFYTTYLDIPITMVGAGLGIAAIAGIFGSVPLAGSADRFGAVRTLAALYCALGFVYCAYLLINGVAGFVVAVSVATVIMRAVPPVNQAVAGMVVTGIERSTVLATMRATRNGGVMVGSALAGLGLAAAGTTGYLIMLLGNAASYLICGALVYRLRSLEKTPLEVRARGLPVVRNVRYLALGLANGMLGLHATMMIVALPLWTTARSDVHDAFIPMIVTIGALLVVLLQVPLSRGVDSIRSARSAVVRAGIALGVSCLLMALMAEADGPILGAVVLLMVISTLTIGEIYQTSSAWVISHDLAPEGRRSEYIATFSLGMSVQQIIGPPLFSAIVARFGTPGWLALGVGFVVASVVYRQSISRLFPESIAENPSAASEPLQEGDRR